jgi:hypothetical protein
MEISRRDYMLVEHNNKRKFCPVGTTHVLIINKFYFELLYTGDHLQGF